MLAELQTKHSLSSQICMDILFRYKIRSVTHLTGRSKQSLFKTSYESQSAIHDLLMQEVVRGILSFVG